MYQHMLRMYKYVLATEQYTKARACFVRHRALGPTKLYTALGGKRYFGILLITKTFEQPVYFGRAVPRIPNSPKNLISPVTSRGF